MKRILTALAWFVLVALGLAYHVAYVRDPTCSKKPLNSPNATSDEPARSDDDWCF